MAFGKGQNVLRAKKANDPPFRRCRENSWQQCIAPRAPRASSLILRLQIKHIAPLSCANRHADASGSATNCKPTRTTAPTRQARSGLGWTEIRTYGANTVKPIQNMPTAIEQHSFNATPKLDLEKLQRWTCQSCCLTCRPGCITSLWLRTRVLQRWMSGPCKSPYTRTRTHLIA